LHGRADAISLQAKWLQAKWLRAIPVFVPDSPLAAGFLSEVPGLIRQGAPWNVGAPEAIAWLSSAVVTIQTCLDRCFNMPASATKGTEDIPIAPYASPASFHLSRTCRHFYAHCKAEYS